MNTTLFYVISMGKKHLPINYEIFTEEVEAIDYAKKAAQNGYQVNVIQGDCIYEDGVRNGC